VAALTRAEAEDRHQNGEDYVFAARLACGWLLLLRRDGTDRRDPARADHPDPPSPAVYADDVYVELQGARFRAQAEFCKDRDVEGMSYVTSLRISHRKTRGRKIWAWDFYRSDAEIIVKDNRGSEPFRKKEKVTEAEMNRFRYPTLGFCESEALVRTVLDLLRSKGYGELE
jgi:hypothetical protein